MSATDIPSMARLEVERDALAEELRRMAKVLGRSRSGEAMLMFLDKSLLIRLGGAEFAIAGKGRWPGEARVASTWLRALAKVPPTQDPVVIQVRGGRLHIAGSSSPCHWQAAGAGKIEGSLGMGLLDVIRLGLSHPDEELEKSGLAREAGIAPGQSLKRALTWTSESRRQHAISHR